MNKPHLVLRKKGSNYFFSNQKTKSENEFFNNKVQGIEILTELIDDEIITKTSAVELLDKILEVNDIPYGPIHPYNQFESDMVAILSISKFRNMLREHSDLEKEPGLPKFKTCQHCGEHGKIMGEKFLTIEFYDKEEAYEAVDSLIDDGKINRQEEKKIRKQIEESNLPAKDTSKIASLN